MNSEQQEVLSELLDLQEHIERLKSRIEQGIPVGSHAVLKTERLNYLLGKYAAKHEVNQIRSTVKS